MSAEKYRRITFDAIADGWGSDNLEDLLARCQLIAEYWRDHFPLSLAEHKVARAMQDRLRKLGGIPPAEFMQ